MLKNLHVLLIALTLALPRSTWSQDVTTAHTVTLLPDWAEGDTCTYKLTRTKTGQQSGRSTVLLHLKILAMAEASFDLECRYSDLDISLTEAPQDPKALAILRKMLIASEGLRVVVRVSRLGVIEQVLNGGEIQRHLEKVLKEVTDLSSNAEEKRALTSALSKALTRESAEIAAVEDLERLLFPYGVEYPSEIPIEATMEIPNPFGGLPLPGNVTLTMTNLDLEASVASIETKGVIDTGRLPGWIKQVEEFGGFSLKPSERAELERKIRDLKFSDDALFEISLPDMWVTKAHWVRHFSSTDFDKLDERLYELQ